MSDAFPIVITIMFLMLSRIYHADVTEKLDEIKKKLNEMEKRG